MSSNDRGDEPQVTNPPAPRSRPGRPASSARRAPVGSGDGPASSTGDRSEGNEKASGPRRPAGGARAAATVADPSLDDTVETIGPTIPLDPLLRTNGNGNGTSRNGTGTSGSSGAGAKGNGRARSNGNGTKAPPARNGSGTRAKTATGGGNGKHANVADASEKRRVGAAAADAAVTTDAAVADTPVIADDSIIEASAVEAAPASTPAATIDTEVPASGTTVATTDVTTHDGAPVIHGEPSVAPGAGTVGPPLADAVDTVVAAVVDEVDVETSHVDAPASSAEGSPALAAPLPAPEAPAAGASDTEPPSPAPASDAPSTAARVRSPSRWSLRNLRPSRPAAPEPDSTGAFAPPHVGDFTDLESVNGSALAPPARPRGPITSPIPIQPPPTTEQPASMVPVAFAPGFTEPLALVPEHPPYRQPLTTFDPGLFHTGPVELDPALDPDRPQRAPRPKPVQVAAVRRRGRPRLRRVTRVVRHVDPWSVFKVAFCFSLILYGVCLTAGVLLWNVAYTTGTIDNVQRFFESFGWDTFRFKGGELYHNAWIAGLFCAIGLTGMIVLAATLFNLITDLVGGIRVTVLEEEVIERDPAERPSLLRRRSRHTTSTVPNAGRRDDDEVFEFAREPG